MSEFAKAVEAVGGQSAMARVLGGRPIRQGHIYKWLRAGLPPKHCLILERATEGRFRCERLRPDLTWIRDRKGRVTHYLVKVADERKAA